MMGRHSIKLVLRAADGVTAEIICQDPGQCQRNLVDECPYREIWGWDEAAQFERYVGREIVLADAPLHDAGGDEYGFDWEFVIPEPTDSETDRG